jgi:hypothetical protein
VSSRTVSLMCMIEPHREHFSLVALSGTPIKGTVYSPTHTVACSRCLRNRHRNHALSLIQRMDNVCSRIELLNWPSGIIISDFNRIKEPSDHQSVEHAQDIITLAPASACREQQCQSIDRQTWVKGYNADQLLRFCRPLEQPRLVWLVMRSQHVLRNMRECSKCLQLKLESEFSKGVGYKDGLRRQCKDCCIRQGNKWSREKRKRKCPKCGETKEASSFGHSDTISTWCLTCRSECARKWRANNPEEARTREASRRNDPKQKSRIKEYGRLYRLFVKYGITVADYDDLFDRQKGLCAICKEPPSPTNTRSGVLHVDHCHASGKIRGLLCFPCNTMLGSARDSVIRLKAAIAYIQEVNSPFVKNPCQPQDRRRMDGVSVGDTLSPSQSQWQPT